MVKKKTPGNGRLNNLNDPVLNVLVHRYLMMMIKAPGQFPLVLLLRVRCRQVRAV